VHYVQKLQGPKETAPADSTKATAAPAEVKKEEKTK
jgi:hypothetical protein